MILDKLAQSTYKRVEKEKKQNPLEEVKAKALAMEKGNFEFEKALKSGDITFICEVKKLHHLRELLQKIFLMFRLQKNMSRQVQDVYQF